MNRDLLTRHPVIPTLVVGITVGFAASALVATVVSAENPNHALGHLATALPFGIMAGAATRIWPPPRPTRMGWLSRRALVWGCWLVVAGSAVEAIGAFGYDDTGGHAIPALTYVHNASWPLGFGGLFLVLCGSVLALGSRLKPVPA